MRLIALCTLLFCGITAATADPASPDVAIFQTNAVIAAGSTAAYVTLGTVPAGKRLVIQTVSVFRTGAVQGSVGSVFIGGSTLGTPFSFGVPDRVADGATYVPSTLSATFYVDAGTSLTANAYRTGVASAAETVTIVLTGYYVTEPA